jgi:hypothetical protein
VLRCAAQMPQPLNTSSHASKNKHILELLELSSRLEHLSAVLAASPTGEQHQLHSVAELIEFPR